jgi:hypothetical protein
MLRGTQSNSDSVLMVSTAIQCTTQCSISVQLQLERHDVSHAVHL